MNIFKYEDFKEYSLIKENFNNGDHFTIPGLHNTSASLILDDIVVYSSKGRVYSFSINEFTEFISDETNLDPYFIRALEQVYQKLIISRYDSFVVNKIKSIKDAEEFELFDITHGGFFENIKKDLRTFGADEAIITGIVNKLPFIYDTGDVHGLQPDSLAYFEEYLNSIIEFGASKIYLFFKFISQESLIKEPVSSLNNEPSDEFATKDASYGHLSHSDETSEIKHSTFADYQKQIQKIAQVVNRAALFADIRVTDSYDFIRNRPVDSTTIYVAHKIENTNIIIKSILSPVEHKKVIGNADYLVFQVIDLNKMNNISNLNWLKNEKQIGNAIIELMK